MIIKILGWIWLITGIIALIKPDWMRKRLQKKSIRKFKWFLIGLAWVIGVWIIKTAALFDGIVKTVLIIIGIIGIIKGFIFISGKASDKFIDWFTKQPIVFYRCWAMLSILIGIFFIYIK